MCSREVSDSTWSTQTYFIDSWVSVTLGNCWIQSLRRRQSPRTSESVENWSLWVQKRFWLKFHEFVCPQNLPLQHLQIIRLISNTHFWGFGGVGGLYVRAKGISHTLKPKTSRLWNIWSRFDLIFASVILHVMTQRCVRAGSSHSISSSQTVFTDFWVFVTLNNCRIQSLRRR